MKKQTLALILVSTLLLVLYAFFLGSDVALRPMEVGTGQVTCRLVNPTLHSMGYGEPFYLEYLEPAGWTPVNDRGADVNFLLPLYILRPMTFKTLEFRVSLYSDLSRPGTYRIVFPVTVSGQARDLYCQFTVQ